MLKVVHSVRTSVAATSVAALVLAGCASQTTSLSSREKQVQSNSTDVAFKNCGSQCQGTIDGAKYSIVLPQKWNGTLLLYSHGYRFATPGRPTTTSQAPRPRWVPPTTTAPARMR